MRHEARGGGAHQSGLVQVLNSPLKESGMVTTMHVASLVASTCVWMLLLVLNILM